MRWIAIVVCVVLQLCATNGNHYGNDYYSSNYCWEDSYCTSLWAPTCDFSTYWCQPGKLACQLQPGARFIKHHVCSVLSPSCGSPLLTCNITSEECEPSFCTSDIDCTGNNEKCNMDEQYCDCYDGYSVWNGECDLVLGRSCLDWTDCSPRDGRYNCTNNVCSCDEDEWYITLDGICESYWNKECVASKDCGFLSNTTCTGGKCLCSDGYAEKDGKCLSVYGTFCTSDSDCGSISGMVCESFNQYMSTPYPTQFPPDMNWTNPTQFPWGMNWTNPTQFPWGMNWTDTTQFPWGMNWTNPTQFPWGMNWTDPSQFPWGMNWTDPSQFPWGMNWTDPSQFPWGMNWTDPSQFPWGMNWTDPSMYMNWTNPHYHDIYNLPPECMDFLFNGSYSTGPPGSFPPYYTGPTTPYYSGSTPPFPTGQTPPYYTGSTPPFPTGQTPPYYTGPTPPFPTPDYWTLPPLSNISLQDYCLQYMYNDTNQSWTPPTGTWTARPWSWTPPTGTWTPPTGTWTPPAGTWTPPTGTWTPPTGIPPTGTSSTRPGNDYDNLGMCKCEKGFTFSGSACIRVVGSSCSDVTCGNTNHWSYEHLGDYWMYYYYRYYHDGFYCNVENVCACEEGYFESEDGICKQVRGEKCDADMDCVGPAGMFSCDEGTCDCGPAYTSTHNMSVIDPFYHYTNYYFWYDYDGNSQYMCKSVIGMPCSENDCSAAGGVCGDDDKCVCQPGMLIDGMCTLILGHSCDFDGQCSGAGNSYCSETGCTCRDGFIEIIGDDNCEPILSGLCTTNADCPINGGICLTEGVCGCDDTAGLTEVEYQCLRADCGEVYELPDLYRRSPSYQVTSREPMVSDMPMLSGWYNLGWYEISDATSSPQKNYCGTKYPIYLTDGLSGADWTTLNAGGEVTKTAMIGEVGAWGVDDTFEVNFRTCGSDLHVNYAPPPVASAGLCVDTGISSNPSRNSTGHWSMVKQSLTFNVDGMDSNGNEIYAPEVKFQCMVFDEEHTYYPYNYYSTDGSQNQHEYFINDGRWYTVHWYLNGINLANRSPFQRSDLTWTDLHESEVRDFYPTVGFNIRCSYEWSESPFGQRSTPVFSAEVATGFGKTALVSNTDGLFAQLPSPTPIGCRGIYEPSEKTCEITWNLADDSACSASLTTTPHPLCGLTLTGVTKAGLEYYGSWESAAWNMISNYTLDSNTGSYVYKEFGAKVLVDASEAHGLGDIFQPKFGPTSFAGHPIWDNYVMPSSRIIVQRESNMKPNMSCSVTMKDVPIVTKNFGDRTEEVRIEWTGEYVMTRSNVFPVEVQLKTEECTTAKGGICVCAFTVMNGDFVGTWDVCGGVNRERATLFGSNNIYSLDQSGGLALNGILGSVTMDYDMGSITASLGDWLSTESFDMMDGLCMFDTDKYTMITGDVSQSSDGFVESWMLAPEHSLLNPASHVAYAYTENFYQCDCPESSENIPTSEDIDTTWMTYRREYTGLFRCTMATDCAVEHEGIQWNGSVLPEFTITNTSVYNFIDANGELSLGCSFPMEENYQYQTKWLADDVVVLTDTSPGTNPSITVDNLYTAYSAISNIAPINRQWSCEVTVMDGETALLTATSQPSSMVEFESTMLEMPRGGEVSMLLRVHLPVTCISGGPTCGIEIQFHDDTDTCQDATIAVKGAATCGVVISGGDDPSTYPQDREVRLTTSNNNNNYDPKDYFELTIDVKPIGDVTPHWAGTYKDTMEVFVSDENSDWKNTFCYATNDPRLSTFDGNYFSVVSPDLVGEYTMVRHQEYNWEVRMLTELCNGGWGVCACGVIVQAGQDVFIVAHCDDDHMIEYLRYDDGVLEAKRRSSNRHNIYLPNGGMVEVVYYRSEWSSLMNIMIYLPPSDMNKTEGLCGNYNGEKDDDFIHGDGVTVTTIQDNLGWWELPDTDAFSESWGLKGVLQESLLSQDYLDGLPPYSEDAELCVCPPSTGASGRTAICSKKEDQMCVGDPVVKLGDTVDTALRAKRSVGGYRREDYTKERLSKLHRSRLEVMSSGHNRRKRQTGSSPNAAPHEEALEICSQYFNQSCPVGNLDSESTPNGTDSTKTIEDCAKDVMLDKTVTDWAKSSCVTQQVTIETVLEKDKVFKANNEHVAEEIENLIMCPGDCSGHGTCTEKDTCVCSDEWSGKDCETNTSIPLEIKSLQGDGKFERTDIGTCVPDTYVSTDGCVPSLTCKVTSVQFKADGTRESSPEPIDVNSSCEDGYTVTISFPCSRRKRSTSSANDTTVASGYDVAISNDGTNFGATSTLVILDSSCLQYSNGTISITPGYCVISGLCYEDGNYSTDGCNYCNVTEDPYNWQFDDTVIGCVQVDANNDGQDNDGGGDEDGGGTSGAIIAVAVVIPLLILGGGIAGIYIYKNIQAKKLNKARTDANLYDASKNKKFKFRVEPTKEGSYVQDYNIPGSITNPNSESAPDNLYTGLGLNAAPQAPEPILPGTETV